MRLLIAILLLSWTTPSFAQDDTIPALNAAGSAAMAEGRHREAADYFGRALQALEAQGGTGHATIIVIGDNLAMALFSAGLAADGAAAFAGLDARRDAMDATDPAGHARYLQDRAGAYRGLNRNAEASALLARLAALQRDRLEDQRDAAAETLALAAFLADAAGHYAQSAALYRELTELAAHCTAKRTHARSTPVAIWAMRSTLQVRMQRRAKFWRAFCLCFPPAAIAKALSCPILPRSPARRSVMMMPKRFTAAQWSFTKRAARRWPLQTR